MSLLLSIDGTDRRTDGHPTVTRTLTVYYAVIVIDYNNKMTKMPMHFLYGAALAENIYSLVYSVVKLLSKRWWIPTGARPEGPKLEPEGPSAEVGFPTADQGLSSIQGTVFCFRGI